MINLLRYYTKIYFKSNKFIAPVLLWLIFLYANYTVKPASYVPSLSSSGGILYMIMIWIGFGYMESEDNISSQLIILKVGSVTKYNFSKILFLLLSVTVMSILGIIVPVTQHMINGYSFFTRNLTIGDLVYGFILLYVLAFLGAMLGSLFHPRIVKNRKAALITAFIIGLFGYIKGALIDDFPVSKFILWAFPPVYDMLLKLTNLEFFSLPVIAYIVAMAAGYGLILLIVQLYMLRKNKF